MCILSYWAHDLGIDAIVAILVTLCLTVQTLSCCQQFSSIQNLTESSCNSCYVVFDRLSIRNVKQSCVKGQTSLSPQSGVNIYIQNSFPFV